MSSDGPGCPTAAVLASAATEDAPQPSVLFAVLLVVRAAVMTSDRLTTAAADDGGSPSVLCALLVLWSRQYVRVRTDAPFLSELSPVRLPARTRKAAARGSS